MSDAVARSVLQAIAPDQSLAWYQAVGAVARGESSYGNGWKGEGVGSNNWGSVQCGHGPPCGDDCFSTQDTHADGTPYTWCYKRYASPKDGAADFVRIMVKQNVANALGGDVVSAYAVAKAMHDNHYFELALDKYAASIFRNAQAIASSLGEDLAVVAGGPGDSPSGDSGSGGMFLAGIALLGGALLLARRR